MQIEEFHRFLQQSFQFFCTDLLYRCDVYSLCHNISHFMWWLLRICSHKTVFYSKLILLYAWWEVLTWNKIGLGILWHVLIYIEMIYNENGTIHMHVS
jgi:hypothetical protein